MRAGLCFLLLALIAFSAFAQSDRGTITGTISDPAGAVIASAAIEARNVATGAVYPAASSGTGNFTIAQLPVGEYQLTITVAGFKKFIRTGLVVEVAGTLRVDAKMELGAATESVTITEAAALLKTEGGEVSHNIATSTLDDIPILTLTGAAAGVGSADLVGERVEAREPLRSCGHRVVAGVVDPPGQVVARPQLRPHRSGQDPQRDREVLGPLLPPQRRGVDAWPRRFRQSGRTRCRSHTCDSS